MSVAELPLRPAWRRLLSSAVVLAVVLALLFAAMRVVGTLAPRDFRWALPLGFILMAAAPWVFLQRRGRDRIGLVPVKRYGWYPIAIVAGCAAASLCFVLGVALFGHGEDNWFVTIASSYRGTLDTVGMDLLRLHLIFTLPALLFSPIGEEIFFRGFLQEALQDRYSVRTSTLLEAGLFGLVHLCHHGLTATVAGIELRPVSGLVWMVLMFCAALLFAWLRRASGSLYPAMAGHAAFNATMNGMIFAALWN